MLPQLIPNCRLDDLVPTTPHPRSATGVNGTNGKRKGNFDTPSAAKAVKPETNGSNFKTPHKPNGTSDGLQYVESHERLNLQSLTREAGQ